MPSLSLCMIVRDEAEGLARAIDSFEAIADEVVVVDTGSVDDTVAVAHRLGARVVHHHWQDDFSAARMAGFRAATGNWVFVLDSDEWLLTESRDEVRRLVDRGDAEAYIVTRRDLTAHGATEMSFVRLAMRDLGRRMEGRIHEHVVPPFTHVERSSIVIEHAGYLPGRGEARLRRNVRLLEMELAERPGQAYYLADLTHAYWLLHDSRWVETLGETIRRLDLSCSRPPLSLASALLEIVFAAPAALLPANVTHELADALAERWYPRSVPLLVARARLAFGRGDLARSADLGERAVNAWESGDYDRSISFDPAIVGPELRLNLGVALARTGRLAESLARFEEASRDPRFAPAAGQNATAVRAVLDAPVVGGIQCRE